MEVSWYMQEKKKWKTNRGEVMQIDLHESLRMFFIYFHLLFIFIG